MQCTSKSRMQYTAKCVTGPGSRIPCSRPGGRNRYVRRAPSNSARGCDRHGIAHVLANIGETRMDNLIGEEEERYYFYLLDACLTCFCGEDQRKSTRTQQLHRREQVP